ncbi:TRAP transporter substrate-binding protein [Oceanobacillus longus]|uniref:TRAP transporter substrate-binding protein n=1 Tax=Oceanobacillus longus TaxID=930120 RepID=A0ABV8GZS1_9BACI
MERLIKMTLTIMAISFLFIIVACSDDTSTTSEGEDTVEAVEGKEEVYKLKLNSINSPHADLESPAAVATIGFAERVEERTDGRVEIEIFYNNQLAGQSEALDALARGTIDLQVFSHAAWADKIPESDWGSLPYAFQGEESLSHLLNETEFGDLYAEALGEYGVKPLHIYYSSAAGYMSNTPIAKKDDFSGTVLSGPSPNIADYYSSLGAGIASVSFVEYYESLLRGTIDGITFPYYTLDVHNLHEVVDYVTIPGEVDPAISGIAVSQSTWDDLPSDIQEIILEVSKEVEAETLGISKQYTQSGIQFAEENGVEVVEMNEEDYNELREISKETYWKNFGKQNDRTKQMVDILLKTIEELDESGEFSYEEYVDSYR